MPYDEGASTPCAILAGECGVNDLHSVRHGFEDWYVLHICQPLEPLIFRFLSWVGLEYYQFTHLERIKGQKPERAVTFPGYLFIRFNVHDTTWREVYRIPGVVSLLSTDHERPIPLPRGMMEQLVEFHRSRRIDQPAVLDIIEKGSQLQIINGPLKNVYAECAWTKNEIVGVFVTIFGRQSQVTLRREDVVKASAPPPTSTASQQ